MRVKISSFLQSLLMLSSASAFRDAIGAWRTTFPGNLDADGNKITNLSAGSTSGDSVEYDQFTTALGDKANSSDLSTKLDATGGTWTPGYLGGTLDADGYGITGLPAPSGGSEATNKDYVDGAINDAVTGLDWKDSAKVATTAPLASSTYSNGASGVGATLTANSNGALGSIDGQSVSIGDRILVKNQATAAQNGLYAVTAVGGAGAPWVLTRTTDADSNTSISDGMAVSIDAGSASAGSIYKLNSTGAVTVGTTSLNFSKISGATLLATNSPENLASSATVGTSSRAAREDHVHSNSGLVLADGSGLTGQIVTKGRVLSQNTVATTETVTTTDDINYIDANSANWTGNFPAATGSGTEIVVKRKDMSSHTAVATASAGDMIEQIDGTDGSTFSFGPRECFRFVDSAAGFWSMI